MTITQILLLALIPTILIELAVLLLLRERSAKVLTASVVINILTNVPLNLYVNYISNSLLTILCGESLLSSSRHCGTTFSSPTSHVPLYIVSYAMPSVS